MQNDDSIMNLLFEEEKKNINDQGRWPTFKKPVDSCFGGLINNIDLNMGLLLPKFGADSIRKNSEERKTIQLDSAEKTTVTPPVPLKLQAYTPMNSILKNKKLDFVN